MNDCVCLVLCKPFDNRIVGKIKGRNQKKRGDLLIVQVPDETFLERDLLLRTLLNLRGMSQLLQMLHDYPNLTSSISNSARS